MKHFLTIVGKADIPEKSTHRHRAEERFPDWKKKIKGAAHWHVAERPVVPELQPECDFDMLSVAREAGATSHGSMEQGRDVQKSRGSVEHNEGAPPREARKDELGWGLLQAVGGSYPES